MRAWAIPVAMVLLAGACADVTAGPGEEASGPTGRPRPTAVPTPPVDAPRVGAAAAADAVPPDAAGPTPPAPAAGLDLGMEPASILGLITPNGIPVAVLAETDEGYVVRSPCGAAVVVSGGEPIGDVEVVLDPGHGSEIDTGAIGPNGLVERDLNLALAKATQDLLRRRGIGVVLTRVDDYLSPLRVRARFADHLGAEILVSIHHNAPVIEPSVGPGTETFVQSGSEESARLGRLLQEFVVRALSPYDLDWTTAPDAGVLRVLLPSGRDAYGMLRNPTTPTALVELGYIANASEAEWFATDEYLAVGSTALADAVEAYLRTNAPGAGREQPDRTFTPDLAPGADVCVEQALE